jgi:HSP20 family molecular chaperone IbpA
MLKFLSRIFGSHEEKPDLSNLEVDEKNSYAEVKKNKLNTDHYIEESFYVHDEPDPQTDRNIEMPSKQLEAQHVDNTVQIVDERTGNMISVDAQTASQQLEQHAPGLNIPGIGAVGGKNQRPQQRPPQRRPQPQAQPQPMQPQPSPQPMQQQPMQQQPMQQPIQQPMQQPMQIPVQKAAPKFPNVEVATLADSYHLFMDLAGVDKSTLGITFNGGYLSISGKRESNIEKLKKQINGNTKGRKKNPILKKVETIPKFLMGSFTFEYPFEKMVDESSITATLDDGVLHVTLPHRTKGEAVSVSIG